MAKKKIEKKKVIVLVKGESGSLEYILNELGFEVVEFNESNPPRRKVDLFVIDFIMSIADGVNSINRVKKIQRKKEPKILCISGISTKRSIATAEGCDVLERPFSDGELEAKIASMLR